MASYPNAVKSFTAKVDGAGNIIQAAHINDLQDEVAAIEAGLLQGSAPLNSSRSTVAALSVSGGSTLASLSVSGGSTFAARPVMPPPHAARVGLGSTAAGPSSLALVTLSFLGPYDFVTNSSIHSTAANSSQLVPQSTGLWEIVAQAAFAPNSSGFRQVLVEDSSGGVLGQAFSMNIGAAYGPILQASGTKRFDALGGFCKVLVSQDDASTMSISTAYTYAQLRKL